MSKTKSKPYSIYLVGNPNSGKSLLFNRLTGGHAKVANYPGITVDIHKGRLKGTDIQVLDLPGTYSLQALSEDEKVTTRILAESKQDSSRGSLLLLVLDATKLERSLYLAKQVLEQQSQCVVALTMTDQLGSKNRIDVEKMQATLGVPVVSVSGATGLGVDALNQILRDKSLFCTGAGSVAAKSHKDSLETIERRYREVEVLAREAGAGPKAPKKREMSERLDDFLLHPLLGPLGLLVIFGGIFEALFTWSEPLVGGIETTVEAFAGWLRPLFGSYELLGSLVVDGVVAGIGSVLAFVPLVAILFFLLGFLEDSGYLARAAFLLDRLMGKVGLPSRALSPLVSGFACAVPAIMAARTISCKKSRFLTILVTPFMSCSARLPVYALLIGAVFSSMPPLFGFINVGTLVMFSMYGLGIVMTGLVGFVMKHVYLKGDLPPLIIELPPYRLPRLSALLLLVRTRATIFVREVTGIILAMTVIMWALFTFPQTDVDMSAQSQLESSYAGQLGKFMEPVFRPLGYDWKLSVGVLASFAAREVFVSTLAVAHGIASADKGSRTLRAALMSDVHATTQKPVYTPLVALSLMIFFALSMQCMSTVAMVRKETKSYRWPLAQLGLMTGLAWAFAFVAYQGGLLLGFA